MPKQGELPNGENKYTKYVSYAGGYIVVRGLRGGDLYEVVYKGANYKGATIEEALDNFIENSSETGAVSRIEDKKESIISSFTLEGYYICPDEYCSELRDTLNMMQHHLRREHDWTDPQSINTSDLEEYDPTESE